MFFFWINKFLINFFITLDETLKRITLLPEKITEDFKITLKKIVEVSQKILAEIGNGVANEILVKSSPSEVSSIIGSYYILNPSELSLIVLYCFRAH